ncbi:MAG: ROK family protein, partial [Sulfurifustaceae bacterium]
MFRIGVDLGGTKTEAIVLSETGTVLARERRATPAAEGYDAILRTVVALVQHLEASVGQTCRVGVGTPGAISTRTGRLKNSNTTCLNGQPLLDDLQQRLAREIRLANDANCFALSEARDGAARDAAVVFGVILGTGVGGGIVVHGKLLQGLQHIAGEWGHNVLEADGPACYCGKRGCVETFLSGPGFLRDYRSHGGSASSVPELVAQAQAGDAIAQAALERYLDRFGRALATVVNILDPDVIVLGGGLSNVEALYTIGHERLARYVFNEELLTTVRSNVHGDSSGVRGAAQLW